MVRFPAACEKCGAIFWTHVPFVGGGRTYLHNNITNCRVPGCGGWAVIAEGVFDVTREGVEILSAPEVTYEMLIALRALVQSAHDQQWPIEKLREEAKTISPLLGGLFNTSTWTPEVKQGCIVALGAIIAAYIAMHQCPSVTNHQIVANLQIDPTPILDAIQGVPPQLILDGKVDDMLAERARSGIAPTTSEGAKQEPILGPPKLKPKR